MHSHTYRQASALSDSPSTASLQPERNAGFLRRRLSAEEIRDSILFVSGLLDREPGSGHPFPTPTGWGYTQHAPFIAVYEHDKRSIYLMTQRLKRHPFLALFDGADPNASTADRLGSTVPTQALYFLNDPFVHRAADAWSTALRNESDSRADQVRWAYRTAFGRQPSDEQLQAALDFMDAYQAELLVAMTTTTENALQGNAGTTNGPETPGKVDATAEQISQAEWKSLAALLRTLIGSNEFLHID